MEINDDIWSISYGKFIGWININAYLSGNHNMWLRVQRFLVKCEMHKLINYRKFQV